METTKENIIKAYNVAKETGADSTCKVLETLYPDIDFTPADNRPVTERIKTFADACAELGEDHLYVQMFRDIYDKSEKAGANVNNDVVAYLKLRIITAALNEGWEPQFTQDEERWYPWFFLYTDEELAEKSEEWKRDRHLTTMQYHRGEWAGLASAYSHITPPRVRMRTSALAFALRATRSRTTPGRLSSTFGWISTYSASNPPGRASALPGS